MDGGILFLIVGVFVMVVIAGMIGFLIYDMSKDEDTTVEEPKKESYSWKAGPWDECDVQCGDGKQTRDVTCYDDIKKATVSDDKCKDLKDKPPESQSCTKPACTSNYRWKLGSFGPCSEGCGGGKKTKQVLCVDTSKDDNPITDSSLCDDSKKPTPEPRDCNAETCPPQDTPRWVAGDWGACSRTCGTGTQTRTVECKSGQGTISDSRCTDTKPSESQSCNTGTCPPQDTPRWVTGDWGACSRTCGSGTQTRSVLCQRGVQTLDDVQCSGIGTKPATSQSCNTQTCTTTDSSFQKYNAFNRQYPVGACGERCTNCGLENSRWSIISPYMFDRWEDNNVTIDTQKFQVLRLKYQGCSQIDGSLKCGTNAQVNSLCKKLCVDVDDNAKLSSIHFTVNHDCLQNPRSQGMQCYTDGSGGVSSNPKAIYIYGPKETNEWKVDWVNCGDATFSGCGSTIYSMKINLHVNSARWNKQITDYIKTSGYLRIALPLSILRPECQDWRKACNMKNKPNYPCMITPYMIKEIGSSKYGDHDYCPMVPLG